MLLSEFLQHLAYGELSQLALGDISTGSIEAESLPKIISQINMGMIALYTRFPLLERSLTLQQYNHITTYQLNSRYAVTNTESTEKYKYIVDSIYEPFKDDIIRIGGIYSENGAEIGLNDSNDILSIYTPTYDSIQISVPNEEMVCFINYRASSVPIPLSPTEDELSTLVLQLPASLVEALSNYVAYRIYGNRPNQESQQESQLFYNKYDSICINVESKNVLLNGDSTSNLKLNNLGWK